MTTPAISGMDPYFLAAYNMPNPYAQYSQQAAATQTAAQSAAAAEQTAVTAPAEKKTAAKSSSNTGLIVSGVAAVGAAALCLAAHKKGGEKGMSEGFRQIWKGLRGKSEKQMFLIAKENGKTYCKIPRLTQNVTTSQAEALGISLSNDIPKLGSEGTSFKFMEFTHNGNKFRIDGNGKIHGYVNSQGKSQLSKLTSTESADVEYKKSIDDVIKKLMKGETADGAEVTKQYYTHTENGVTRKFITKDGNTTMADNIRIDRFATNSNAVKALRLETPKIDETLKEVEKGKIPQSCTIASAEYPVDNSTSIVIKNDKITGIQQNGRLYDLNSSTFKAYKYDNRKVFENIENLKKDKKLQNIVYAVT